MRKRGAAPSLAGMHGCALDEKKKKKKGLRGPPSHFFFLLLLMGSRGLAFWGGGGGGGWGTPASCCTATMPPPPQVRAFGLLLADMVQRMELGFEGGSLGGGHCTAAGVHGTSLICRLPADCLP